MEKEQRERSKANKSRTREKAVRKADLGGRRQGMLARKETRGMERKVRKPGDGEREKESQ